MHSASETYHEDTSYKTPALFIALCGERDLYDEAIYVFYKTNTVYYRYTVYNNEGNYEIDGLDGFKNLNHLGVDMTYNDNLGEQFITMSYQMPTFSGQVANHLETLSINTIGNSKIPKLLEVFRQHLAKLKRVSLNVATRPNVFPVGTIMRGRDVASGERKRKKAWLFQQHLNLSHRFGVKGT